MFAYKSTAKQQWAETEAVTGKTWIEMPLSGANVFYEGIVQKSIHIKFIIYLLLSYFNIFLFEN